MFDCSPLCIFAAVLASLFVGCVFLKMKVGNMDTFVDDA